MAIKIRLYIQIISLLVILNALPAFSQSSYTISDYISQYKDIAMAEMRAHGIPASIKLGQGILESGFGNSLLAVHANNHFGIKCHGWPGRTFYKDDDKAQECFRAYDDPVQSFYDHSQFLTSRPRYASLFNLDLTDYKGWARGLRQAGYATNPQYPDLLIRVIEQNKLYEFDQMVVNGRFVATNTVPSIGPVVVNTPSQANSEGLTAMGARREVELNNSIKYVIARQGDTPESLAKELGLWKWEIQRYNDLGREDKLKPGQIVYLQPKRRNARQGWHVVGEGESLYDISQQHGVKLSMLLKRNSLQPGVSIEPGTRLKLKAFAGK
jgi:LysM repeat protein